MELGPETLLAPLHFLCPAFEIMGFGFYISRRASHLSEMCFASSLRALLLGLSLSTPSNWIFIIGMACPSAVWLQVSGLSYFAKMEFVFLPLVCLVAWR